MAVAYTPELLSRVQTWLSYSASKRRTAGNLAELHQLYAAITGQSAAGCTNCNFSGYVGILEAYQRQSLRHLFPETVKSSSYTLAPGLENETLVHESYSKTVTADNITDEDAEFFIKNGFPHAFLKNGKVITAEAEATTPKLKTKADFQARYKELFGEDADEKLIIAQLTEAIEAKEQEQADQRD